MADAERIDEALERNLAPLADRAEQVAHRGFAVALDLLQLELRVARLQREDVGRLLDPAFLEEIIDLLLRQALDVERAARDESFRCSVFWNGQANSPEQRKRTPSSPAELISRTTGVFSGHGQVFGNA